jgi:hypothetical protein
MENKPTSDGVYGNKTAPVIKIIYDMSGKPCTETATNQAVAKKIKTGENYTYYVRTEGLSPVHHEKFDQKNVVINPTFSHVDQAIFDDYINYLKTKKEGFYIRVKNNMKTRGFI